MAYAMFLNISDKRKDSLNRWMCDAKMLDMILCNKCEEETDTPESVWSARSINELLILDWFTFDNISVYYVA